jgi:hypothetical protein
MRNGFTTGQDVRWEPQSASYPVKMHCYPVRRIGIQEISEAAASLLGMNNQSVAQS